MRINCSVTIYNKYIVAGAEKYQRAEIPVYIWENRKAANVLKSGLLEADSVSIYIPFSLVSDYMKPVAWQSLVKKSGRWTLQVGDVIVKGIVMDEITDTFTISDLKKKYDDVVTVRSVDTMDQGSLNMRHFQVGCS